MSKLISNYKAILKLLGIIIFIIGIAMIIPWIYAEATGDISAAGAFRLCAPLTVVTGGLITFFLKIPKVKFRAREGYIVVAACWILASVIGSFPYYLSGFTDTYIDAFFEATSGFTTTGCTAVASGIMTRSLLLWKAISHWLGGMGIIIFVISILPAIGVNGQYIARAESPGPVLEKMTFRLSDSAKILYITYLLFTVLEFVLLMLSGKMSAFDSLIHTMGSISTGGLLVHPTGLAYYDSFYIEVVISIFCILGSLNFAMYYYIITGKLSYIIKDVEFRIYMIIMGAAVIICTLGLVAATDNSLTDSFRDSFFQVISMSTTAGYTRSPYMVWPTSCQIILIALMFIGGCAVSTSGSLKVIRVIIMFKLIWRGCIRRIHPRSVVAVKVGGHAVSAPVVSGITAFILTFMGLFLLSSFILSFQGMDLETNMTTALAMLSNTGAAFGETASAGNFSAYHPLLKLYLSFLMIVGRLELFTIIILFTKNFWGRDR
ncbi:MAG TPA: TrkH family potassium uptake protein [Candidatus Copromorpha excrementigallinarum]|uniref:TrkH family potassium uptake protein n=1 Tax=Candidatus Allocopromorpha excrementigallinarum TaxID=2840742 RepID=A0A9D1I0H8_9FIRM|nr:TrkH family potassium uptake protein [Candidatus Copromorpha excrementigallinarum]